MSRYEVQWKPEAVIGLGESYVRAARRADVHAAAQRIDRRLETDPVSDAEPMAEGFHAVTDGPLRVVYEIDAASRRVHVHTTRLLNSHARGGQHGSNGRGTD